MAASRPSTGSLVLYKNKRALVSGVSDKIEIVLDDGKTKRVREKDIHLLHPGPLARLADITELEGEMDEAWELLQGSETDLRELTELIYGEYTPSAAWNSWQRVAEGLHFAGTPDRIVARTGQEVAEDLRAREEKLAAAREWDTFLDRLRGRVLTEEDRERLLEVQFLATGSTDKSRILKALGIQEHPESAHRMLCEAGYWAPRFNPYPLRQGLVTDDPEIPVQTLPDEPRRDLTHLAAFAIDDEGNEDPDDAISIEGDRLWVHIADVASLVGPGTGLDREARSRGGNLYIPEKVVHMLPPQITQRLGLGLRDHSPALSVCMVIGESGEPRAEAIVPSLVTVQRCSYGEIDGRLNEQPFCRLTEFADRFRRRRIAAGAARIDLPEVSVRVDDGRILIRPLRRSGSREMVADIMLMAGEAVSRFALEHEIPIPFASQPPPDNQERPTTMSGMFACRRLMKPSRLKSVEEPHAGLGLEVYTRVTSPLRRYLDLVTHQQLRAYLKGDRLLSVSDISERIAACEPVNAAIRRAERFSNLHWKMLYLMDHPGWSGDAVVVETDDRKATVMIPELALEAKMRLPKETALDTRVRIKVREVDVYALTAWFGVDKGH